MSEDHTDLLIVGAGPAGMAAAVTARRHGLTVRIVDDQPAPGGQIWRGIETVAASPRLARLGQAYRAGVDRAAAFRVCGALYEPQSQLWQIEPGFRAFLTRNGQALGPPTYEALANGYGDNTLVWLPQGVTYTQPGQDVTYHVVVSGMTGGGVPSSIAYNVVVIDPYAIGDEIFRNGFE